MTTAMRGCLHTEHYCCHVMSGAPSNEIKDEPQRGDGCEADAFMNAEG